MLISLYVIPYAIELLYMRFLFYLPLNESYHDGMHVIKEPHV